MNHTCFYVVVRLDQNVYVPIALKGNVIVIDLCNSYVYHQLCITHITFKRVLRDRKFCYLKEALFSKEIRKFIIIKYTTEVASTVTIYHKQLENGIAELVKQLDYYVYIKQLPIETKTIIQLNLSKKTVHWSF